MLLLLNFVMNVSFLSDCSFSKNSARRFFEIFGHGQEEQEPRKQKVLW